MNSPSFGLINMFAEEFARKGKGKGMTNDEIMSYFRKYSNNILPKDFYKGITKAEYFCHCVTRLHVEDQWRALVDLCILKHNFSNPLPSEEKRKELLNKLISYGESNGVSIRFLEIESWGIKREWIKAISRIEKSPEASITAARTMLEKVCKIILEKEGHSNLKEGNLAKLVKSTKKVLNLEGGIEQISQGISTIVYGISNRSNEAGDRHAVTKHRKISTAEAKFICDVCFSLALFFVENYKIQFKELL